MVVIQIQKIFLLLLGGLTLPAAYSEIASWEDPAKSSRVIAPVGPKCLFGDGGGVMKHPVFFQGGKKQAARLLDYPLFDRSPKEASLAGGGARTVIVRIILIILM